MSAFLAYIDPASGLIILQALIAFLVGVALFLRKKIVAGFGWVVSLVKGREQVEVTDEAPAGETESES